MNENVVVGILSYLPNDERVREERKQRIIPQLEQITKLMPDCKIWIVAQQYRDEDYLTNYPNVEYMKYPQPLGISGARNAILERFYASEYEYAMVTDDDALLYDYFEPETFLHEICTNPMKFASHHLDLIYPLNPRWSAFKDPIASEWQKHNTNFYFRRRKSGWVHWVFVRNIRKAYGLELYNDNELNFKTNVGAGYEDMKWELDFIKHGLGTYEMMTYVLKPGNLQGDRSTIFASDKQRDEYHQQSLDATMKCFEDVGVYKNETGWHYERFWQNCWKLPKQVLISRDKPIDVFDVCGEELRKKYRIRRKLW